MSIILSFILVAFGVFISPVGLGIMSFVPVHAALFALVLWRGVTRQVLVWAVILALLAEASLGITMGSMALPFILFAGAFIALSLFISFKPLASGEGYTPINVIMACALLIMWHAIFVIGGTAWEYLLGFRPGHFMSYVLMWFSPRILITTLGATFGALVLYAFVGRWYRPR